MMARGILTERRVSTVNNILSSSHFAFVVVLVEDYEAA